MHTTWLVARYWWQWQWGRTPEPSPALCGSPSSESDSELESVPKKAPLTWKVVRVELHSFEFKPVPPLPCPSRVPAAAAGGMWWQLNRLIT